MVWSPEERKILLSRLAEIDAELRPPRSRQLTSPERRKLREEEARLLEEYAENLPVRAVSRCPICRHVLELPIDDEGLDGPWWWSVCPVELPPPRGCEHFQVFLGALDLHGRIPSEVVQGVLPGPGAPFVIERLLSMEGMQAVVSTVAVGAAGEALIAHTHGPAFVDDPRTRLGRTDGNPFHEAVTEAARRAGLRFILNVVLDDEKRVVRVQAGEPVETHARLVKFARSIYEVSIPHRYDVAIGGAGFPKDGNLYQASRAASYLFFAPTPVVKPGGFLIIPARCQEGAGDGVGEQRFLAAMRDAPDVQHILDDARQNGYPPGQQRAFVMAKVLEEARVVIVGSECPDVVRECKMTPAATMEEALEMAAQELGAELDVLIVPHALLTLPVVR